jgi:pimeloyl-ACP methyl ester carboxylesterase
VLVDATHENYAERASALLSRSEKTRRETLKGVLAPSTRSELESLPESGRQVRSARPLQTVPTIVITAGRRDESPVLFELWRQLQNDLARQTGALRHIIAGESGHNVQFDQPELVVGAIREMIDRAGAESRHGP